MSDSEKIDVISYFCRHLVGICIAYRHKNDLKNKDIIIDYCCYADTLSWNKISNVPIEFNINSLDLDYFMDDDELGIDFGFIPIAKHISDLMKRNGVEFLTERGFVYDVDECFERYALLGLPSHLTSNNVSPSGQASISPVMVGVRRTEQTSDEDNKKSFPQFTGQIKNQEIENIKGMSGGPIFGFRRTSDNKLKYWIIAIQGSWKPQARTIKACHLGMIGVFLKKWHKIQLENNHP